MGGDHTLLHRPCIAIALCLHPSECCFHNQLSFVLQCKLCTSVWYVFVRSAHRGVHMCMRACINAQGRIGAESGRLLLIRTST